MTTITHLFSRHPDRAALTPWALVSTGLLALYLPSFINLFRGSWASEKNAHGPIVMAVAFAVLYCRLRQMLAQDVLMRTYVNAAGDQVMLAIACARAQRQDVKLHLPEVCYPAQGYKVVGLAPTALPVVAGGAALPGKHMLAGRDGRLEAVTYWTRISDAYPQGGMAMRMQIFRDGLQGKVSDGVLVRASMVVRNSGEAADAYDVQARFLRQLVAAEGMTVARAVRLVKA